jgi:hypothetical protein
MQAVAMLSGFRLCRFPIAKCPQVRSPPRPAWRAHQSGGPMTFSTPHRKPQAPVNYYRGAGNKAHLLTENDLAHLAKNVQDNNKVFEDWARRNDARVRNEQIVSPTR